METAIEKKSLEILHDGELKKIYFLYGKLWVNVKLKNNCLNQSERLKSTFWIVKGTAISKVNKWSG
jgi:hypothetical protein